MSPELRHLALSGVLSPDDAFDALFGESPYAFWLDSADGRVLIGDGTPDEAAAVDGVEIASETRTTPVEGGWVGWFGYDAGAIAAGAPGLIDSTAPERLLIRIRRLVVIDAASGEVLIAADPSELADLRDRVSRLIDRAADTTDPALPPHPTETVSAMARHSRAEYAERIAACREHIRDGDAYQLCLTTRFTVTGDVDARQAHRLVHAAGRAPHGGLVQSPDATLISASPESFLSVADGVIRTRPIKGTRPRGRDRETDATLARELAESVKEQAENIMIVDLMRNDLQIVCEPGTVTAERLLEIEPHPRVHQLVSTVAGKLRSGIRVGDVLRACFPAGSMTGAPKLSAMTILSELEGAPRGVYAGCFGWIGNDGAMELGMVIRSIVVHPGGAYVGAGGGITWLSDADAELAEVAVKATAPLAALGATLPPDW